MTDRSAQPLVSVVAICFNHERFVTDCLESIAAQDHPNVEIVIIDDCSSDQSVPVIREWLGRTGIEAQLVVHERNVGICASRNDALRRTSGTYLACIATDDAWLPGKLRAQVELMEQLDDDIAVLYGDALQMDEQGALLPATFLESRGLLPAPDGDVYDAVLRRCVIPSLTTLVRRDCVVAVGGYDEHLSFEDWDMWLRLAQRYRFRFEAGPWARYRLVTGSLGTIQNPAYWETIATLMMKHLGSSPARDVVVRRWIRRCTAELLLLGAPEADSWLGVLAEVDPSAASRVLRGAARAQLVGPWLRWAKAGLKLVVRAVRAGRAGRPTS